MKEIIIEKVVEILNAKIKDVKITPAMYGEDLSELGMDSITFIQIIVELEETFDCEIPDSKLLIAEMNTVQKMVDVLKEIYKSQTI